MCWWIAVSMLEVPCRLNLNMASVNPQCFHTIKGNKAHKWSMAWVGYYSLWKKLERSDSSEQMWEEAEEVLPCRNRSHKPGPCHPALPCDGQPGRGAGSLGMHAWSKEGTAACGLGEPGKALRAWFLSGSVPAARCAWLCLCPRGPQPWSTWLSTYSSCSRTQAQHQPETSHGLALPRAIW